jgi:hypothetical protein
VIEDHLQLLNIPLDNFEKKDSFWDPCDPCVFPPNSPEFIVGIFSPVFYTSYCSGSKKDMWVVGGKKKAA